MKPKARRKQKNMHLQCVEGFFFYEIVSDHIFFRKSEGITTVSTEQFPAKANRIYGRVLPCERNFLIIKKVQHFFSDAFWREKVILALVWGMKVLERSEKFPSKFIPKRPERRVESI